MNCGYVQWRQAFCERSVLSYIENTTLVALLLYFKRRYGLCISVCANNQDCPATYYENEPPPRETLFFINIETSASAG